MPRRGRQCRILPENRHNSGILLHLFGVRLLVPQQSSLGNKPPATDRTLVWLHTGVRPRVNDQVCTTREPLAAVLTCKRPWLAAVLGVPEARILGPRSHVACKY